jgi:hypothetical protein
MKARDHTPPVSDSSVPSLDQQVRFAIAHKRLLRFTYDGCVRIAEPHDYGIHREVARVLVYQRTKAGASGRDAIGWRLLDISKIADCAVMDAGFSGTRARSEQRHHAWDVLYARVC